MRVALFQSTFLLAPTMAHNWLLQWKLLLKMHLVMTKKYLLENNVDNKFSIDLKITSGDGLSTGLPTPIEVDLHLDSIVTSDARTWHDQRTS